MVGTNDSGSTLPGTAEDPGVTSTEERTETTETPAGNGSEDSVPDGTVEAGDDSTPAAAVETEPLIDLEPEPETPLADAGPSGAVRYVQAVAEINDLVEGINAELRTPGAPPKVRLKVYRRLPEYAACWLPAIPIQLGSPIDLEYIGDEYGGGIYDLQLQKKGNNVKGALWKGIPFGGPPRMLPGEGIPPPSGPLVYQGTGAHRGVQVVQPAPVADPGVAQLADGIRQLAEGFAATQQTLAENIAQIRTDIDEARRNPPDPIEGMVRSIENVKTMISVFDGLRPEPPPPAPIIGGESKVAETIAIVDAITQRLPGIVAGAQQLLSSPQSVSQPAGQVRPIQTAQSVGQIAPVTAAPPAPPAPPKRPEAEGKPGPKAPRRKSRSKAKGRK